MARGEATRERIRVAAHTLFRAGGFAGTSVREIAAAAEADPALVIRYFGSKEMLFLETMELDVDHGPVVGLPVADLGRRLIAMLIEPDEITRDVYRALVRGSAEPAIAERLRDVHDRLFVAPLRSRLTGDDADLRTRLAAAMIGGLLYSLWVVGDEPLLAADHADVVERYGAMLQSLITP